MFYILLTFLPVFQMTGIVSVRADVVVQVTISRAKDVACTYPAPTSSCTITVHVQRGLSGMTTRKSVVIHLLRVRGYRLNGSP